MKKLYILILFKALLALHITSSDILAQTCSQLGLPENVTSRLCMPENGRADDFAFSPDGKTLACLHDRHKVFLWDIENKKVKLTIDDVKGLSVRYSPDGKTFVCGDVVYDATTGEPTLLLLDGDGYRDFVEFSPDGEILAGAGGKGIRFWKSITEEPTTDALPVDEQPINILPTDTSAVVVANPETDPTSAPFATSSTYIPGIRGLDYSPDGTELAIACNLGIWIYDPITNKEVTLLNQLVGGHSDIVVAAIYSPNGNMLASAGPYRGDNTIRIWDAKTKKNKFTMSRTNSFGRGFWDLDALTFSPNSEILMSSNRNGIDLWDPVAGEYKSTLLAYQGRIANAIFSPNGNTIATSSYDSLVLLWDFASYPIISLSPDSVTSLTVGDEITFDLKITNGKNLSGYQVTVDYDPEVLAYIETKYEVYLTESVPVQPIVNNHSGTITLASLSLANTSTNGDGTLATITFKVNSIETSKLSLQDSLLSNSKGGKSYPWLDGAEILKTITTEDGETTTCSIINPADVNKDCVVNIQDLVIVAINFGSRNENADINGDGKVNIIDLVLVAGEFGNTSDAPTMVADTHDMLSAANVQQWLRVAHKLDIDDPAYQRGLQRLEQLLIIASPKQTLLLPNYPNPFNPETWIPYQLNNLSDVSISIYAVNGNLVRELEIGQQGAGLYYSRRRAAYWDGKNASGEAVASGVYFYTLTAGDFSATRKMLIRK